MNKMEQNYVKQIINQNNCISLYKTISYEKNDKEVEGYY